MRHMAGNPFSLQSRSIGVGTENAQCAFRVADQAIEIACALTNPATGIDLIRARTE